MHQFWSISIGKEILLFFVFTSYPDEWAAPCLTRNKFGNNLTAQLSILAPSLIHGIGIQKQLYVTLKTWAVKYVYIWSLLENLTPEMHKALIYGGNGTWC